MKSKIAWFLYPCKGLVDTFADLPVQIILGLHNAVAEVTRSSESDGRSDVTDSLDL